MITTVRIRNNRAIVLGRNISERSNKRFVLNLPKRLQTGDDYSNEVYYANACVEYLRKFGFGLLEIGIEYVASTPARYQDDDSDD